MKTAGIFSTSTGASREHSLSSEHSLISWKPIFAGLFVSFIIYAALVALGVAIGGATVSSILQNGGNVSGLATSSAIWIGVSSLLALAAGSYFAARTSAYITGRIGAAQGLTIAALFFLFMIFGAGQIIGVAGQGLGSAIGSMGVGAGQLASNSAIQNTVEDSLGGTALKSNPDVVVKGLLTRLIEGNSESAKAYLGYQTGLSSAQLDARYSALESQFQTTMRNVTTVAAEGASKSAISIFFILVVGMGMALLGGAAGAWANYKKPLTEDAGNPQFVVRSAV